MEKLALKDILCDCVSCAMTWQNCIITISSVVYCAVSRLVNIVALLLLSTHSDRIGVDISFTVGFCVCMFVRSRISPARIKLAASNFARWFIGVLGRESPILENFAPQKPKIGRIGQPA